MLEIINLNSRSIGAGASLNWPDDGASPSEPEFKPERSEGLNDGETRTSDLEQTLLKIVTFKTLWSPKSGHSLANLAIWFQIETFKYFKPF